MRNFKQRATDMKRTADIGIEAGFRDRIRVLDRDPVNLDRRERDYRGSPSCRH